MVHKRCGFHSPIGGWQRNAASRRVRDSGPEVLSRGISHALRSVKSKNAFGQTKVAEVLKEKIAGSG